MIVFMTIGLLIAVPVALPSSLPMKELTLFPDTTKIRDQIVQIICDGSYTFGFRASDGTFLIEHKDADGYVTGEFGYTGQREKLSDYISRINAARRSLGLQSIVKKECEKRTNTDIASNNSDSVGAQDAVDETSSIQADLPPGPGENKTIHRERPKLFKFGEALFRSTSTAAESEKLPAE